MSKLIDCEICGRPNRGAWCAHCYGLIEPVINPPWGALKIDPAWRFKRPNIYLDEFAQSATAIPAAEVSFTETDLEALAAMMEERPKIRFTETAVNGQGQPAALKFNGMVFVHPDFKI